MKPPRTVARSRVASTVLAIVLVTVAAIGYRLTDLKSENELVRAPLDQVVAYGGGGVRVSDVRVATTLRQGDDVISTKGLFVVVNVALQGTGRDSLLVSDNRLVTRNGATYRSVFVGLVIKTDPGFETARDYVFEVDPHRVDGLTLELWDKGVTYRYYERTQTPLGITADNAAQWVQAGAGRTVVVPSDDVVRGLP
jgi:hypothetical protein